METAITTGVFQKTNPLLAPKKGYPEKDCDDSNPYLGPFAADGSCIEIFKNLLWQDQHNGTANGDDVASAIAVRTSQIYVAGKVSNKGTKKDFTVRAYHARKGTLLWQDQVGGTKKRDDEATAIAVSGSKVFVAGKITDKSTGEDFTVRTYSTKNGKLLWKDQFDGTLKRGNDQANAIAVKGSRVFVAGKVTNKKTKVDFAVRAYSTNNGKLLWQDHFNGTKNINDEATAIAATSSQVFVAGLVRNKVTGADFAVRAYSAKTGKLLWQDQINGSKGFYDRANAIAVLGTRVFVVGKLDNKSKNEDFTIRAYHTKTGKLLWQDQVNGTFPPGAVDSAHAVAVKGSQVYVAGKLDSKGSDYDFTIRAYNTKNGKLIWQDQVNGTYGMFDRAETIAVSGTTVFAAGMAG